MSTATRPGPFATKPTEQLIEAAEGTRLNRAVGALDLTALGIGAIIGTGIFVIIGEAIAESGPALVISFLLAGITCVFSALAYAELASSLPVSGSAYTYAYATMGEVLAWIIGWDLILEYGVSVAAVAVGWGSYFTTLLDSLFGITLSDSITLPPGDGGTVNVPAFLLVLAVAALLISGVRQSARSNTVMVITKLAVLVFFIVAAATAFNGDHFSDFAPERLWRHRDRGGADLLRLHRLRRGLDGKRGDRQPAAQPADRDRRLARDRHDPLHPGGRGGRRRAPRRPARRATTLRSRPRSRRAPGSRGARTSCPSARSWRSRAWC